MSKRLYKAKSLSGAQREVRFLRGQVQVLRQLLSIAWKERNELAKLAADTPQFYNPFHAMAAKQIRDRILNAR